jgi:single-strand DNA-binding protein
MSLAVITVSGHVGRDADLRFTSGGQPILSFSVAASHYQGSGEQRTEHTDWYAVSLFGPRGEALQRYLLKGTRVTVVGRLSHRHYTRQDGTPGCSLDIVANEIDFSTPRSEASDATAPSDRPPQASGPHATVMDDNIDDVPF